MNAPFVAIAPRPAPVKLEGWGLWLRRNLFSSVPSALVSVIVLVALFWAASSAIQWAVLNAVTAADANACQAARGTGACWGVIHEKGRFILLGRYPQTEHWRPELATFSAGSGRGELQPLVLEALACLALARNSHGILYVDGRWCARLEQGAD